MVLAGLSVMSIVPAQAARNLITNFDHRERIGVDLPMGWVKHIRHRLVTTLEVLPQDDGSVRFTASAFDLAGTTQKLYFADISVGIVSVTAYSGTSSIFSKHPSFTC